MWENIQSIAQKLLSDANVDETRPVSTIKVAKKLDVRVEVTQRRFPGPGPSMLEKDDLGWLIKLRPRLPLTVQQSAVGHELGEKERRLAGYQGPDSELVCDGIGVCIQVPSVALAQEIRGCDPWDKLDHIARRFGVERSAAFLRLCLFLEEPAVLIEGSKLLVVGSWGDTTEADLRYATREDVEGVQRHIIEGSRRPIYILTHSGR